MTESMINPVLYLLTAVGCGVNVTNHYPTMSLNDCITLHQQEQVRRGSEQLVTMKPLSVEQLLALILNKMELYLRLYEKWGLNGVQDLYYQYWMHGLVPHTQVMLQTQFLSFLQGLHCLAGW